MSPLCILRTIVWSFRARAPVAGHQLEQQKPVKGQPACIIILKCTACSTVVIGWRECERCGAPERTPTGNSNVT